MFHKSLSASCFSSSNRIQRSHVHDISPCLSHSAFLSHTAGTFRQKLNCFVCRSASPAPSLFQSYSSAHMCMTSLHALSLRLPFSYGWQLPAHHIYILLVVASPCTSLRHHGQRTGAPPHSTRSVRPRALLHQAFLPSGGHAISTCTCHDHVYATARLFCFIPRLFCFIRRPAPSPCPFQS